MAVRFCPLASGSNGNSALVATDSTRILIDAGLSAKRIESALLSVGESAANIDAIFITHEHTDHIQGAGILSRRYDIPVFATEKTWRQLLRHNMLGKVAEHNARTVYVQENCAVNDMIITPFSIPHDCAAPAGYCVFAEDKKITVATDIGHVTEHIKESIADSDLILLESNHDIDMLLNGPYPEMLKRRVMGERGHLSNASAGNLLAEMITSRLKTIYLGHLSEENNMPLLALNTVGAILEAHKIAVGKDLRLMLANRGAVSEMIEL